MDRWIGKVAVVTGASVGIGAAIAKDLAEKGIIVVALARRIDKLKELSESSKGAIHPRQCDVSDEEQIMSTFRWIEATLGGVDILVNNSGVANKSPLMIGNSEQWQQMWDVNVKGLSICSREALKSMRQRGDNGHIFNINSIAGHVVTSYKEFPLGMYTASKHAVTALTEALRVELLHANSKIKITSISPGGVATDMAKGLFVTDDSTVQIKGMPLDDFMTPEDISEALIYALGTKPNVQVHEILLQPIGQKYG